MPSVANKLLPTESISRQSWMSCALSSRPVPWEYHVRMEFQFPPRQSDSCTSFPPEERPSPRGRSGGALVIGPRALNLPGVVFNPGPCARKRADGILSRNEKRGANAGTAPAVRCSARSELRPAGLISSSCMLIASIAILHTPSTAREDSDRYIIEHHILWTSDCIATAFVSSQPSDLI
jgi:hypothetical protein